MKQSYGGSYKTLRDAELRLAEIRGQLALMDDPMSKRSVQLDEQRYPVFGRVWRLRYRDETGEKVSVVLGRECDGFTREDAARARSRFVLARQENPLTPVLKVVDALVRGQERKHGEALPHLYVAQMQIRQLYRLASLELAANPHVFDDDSDDRISMQSVGVAA